MWCSAVSYEAKEFAIILPGTRLPQAVHTAKRLQGVLSDSPIEFDSESVRLTASFGVDAYRGRENLPVDAFIKRTDRFLFQAKDRGRDCVCYEETRMKEAMTEVTDKEREALLRTPQPGK